MFRKPLSLFVTASAILGASQGLAAINDPHQRAQQMIVPPTMSTVGRHESVERIEIPAFVPPDVRAREMIRGDNVSAATASPQGHLQNHTMVGDLHQRVQAMILCKK